MRVRRHLRGLIVLVLVLAAGIASADSLVDALATDDPKALAAAIAEIERAPATPDLADALFGAARACEERLLDPARALALYDRLIREVPQARVTAAAEQRAAALRASIGAHGEHAREAADFAALVAAADTLTRDELTARADALAVAPWSGAPDAALWVAEVLRRQGAFAVAQRRFADVATRWPDRRVAALRGGTGNAIDAHDWSLATRLAAELPASDPADALIRDSFLSDIAKGRRTDRFYLAAWLALGLAALLLVASLVEASLRGGRRRPSLKPPIEVLFLAPVALVLLVVAFATRSLIAPAIAQIMIGGTVFAWVSAAALDLLRDRGRSTRARALVHIAACVAGTVALGYIAIVRGGLVELLSETVQAGPS